MKHPIPAIVLQYGKLHLTQECIASLRAQTVPMEVWLVDGNSPGVSQGELAATAKMADRHIFLEENMGYATANNRAINELLRDYDGYYLVINNDAVADPDCVEQLLAAAKRHPKAAQIVPKVVYPDGRLQAVGGTIRRDLFEPQLVGHLGNPQAQWPEAPVLYAPGMAVLVSAQATKEAGAIPEGYFMYAEDVDWSLRFQKHGWEVWRAPQARVTHHDSATSGGRSRFKGFYLTRSNVFLAKRWLSREAWHAWLPRMFGKVLRQTIKNIFYLGYARGLWNGFFTGVRESVDIDRIGEIHATEERVR